MAKERVLAPRIDGDSRDGWKFPENPINGKGAGGKHLILSIAMNRLYNPFECKESEKIVLTK